MTTATSLLNEQLAPTGLEAPLDELEQAFHDNLRRFARDVVRPAGQALDRMSAEAVIAPDSPLCQVLMEFAQLGVTTEMLAALAPQ